MNYRALVQNSILAVSSITLTGSLQAQRKPKNPVPVQFALPDAYQGVPYHAQVRIGCEPNCPTFTPNPKTLSDNKTPIDANAAKTGEIRFTSPTGLTGAQVFALEGTAADGKQWSAYLTVNIKAAQFGAGKQDAPVALPDAFVGDASYDLPLSFGATCTKVDSPANLTPAVAGLLTIGADAASPKLTIAPKGATPAKYSFSITCTEGASGTIVSYYTLNVINVPPVVDPAATTGYDDICQYKYNDCDWHYILTGGAEESELSSQSSEITGVVTLFLRGPVNMRGGSIWLEARFLGSPIANSTSSGSSASSSSGSSSGSGGGIVAAIQGSSGTSSLSEVGYGLDYVVGFEHDWFQPQRNPPPGQVQGRSNPNSGMFTVGAIAYFGATTPLSAQNATVAYQAPAYGTNECDILRSQYSSGRYNLPVQTTAPYPYITQTVTSGGNTTPTQLGPFCVINPVPITTTSTSGGTTTTTTTTGTAIQAIAFAPGNRSSFLFKYSGGIRLINRLTDDNGDACSNSHPCNRDVVDVVLGQDQDITGGMLRKWILKTDASIPLWRTGAYFFGSGALRLVHNVTGNPLVLQPASIVTSNPSPPTSVAVPSPAEWTLPLLQPNRDFYRIGLGVDLTSVVQNLFKKSS